MKPSISWHRLALLLGASAAIAAAASPRPYRLPAERPVALPAAPDADLVAAHCSGCHSLDYIVTQPRGKPPGFWRDAVNKMVVVYGAPIDKPDAERIAAYLAATYGAVP